ncbi:CapA family protein [candidate division WOR-3 bacterium]|nr:CapA family protein [candidate division WOR-3 bacterium]
MISKNPLLTIVILTVFFSLAGAGSITIIAVGDIMMGSDYPANMLPQDRGKGLYRNVAHFLSSGDLTLGNLEGVLLEGGVCAKKTAKGKVYAFRTPPSFAQHLADAGFDFFNLANNHLNDFGSQGITSTMKTLTDYGIEYGGPNGKVGEFEINGMRVAIACFATSPGTELIFDIEHAQTKVSHLARHNEIVIVSFHGGREGIGALHTRDTFEYFLGQPRGNVVEFARAVIDSGADLVWGHGPHVPRAIELYEDRLIAYSLGNFCTWGFNLADERGYAPVLKVVLDSTGVFMHGNVVSFLQKQGKQLAVDTLHRAARLVKRLSAEDFPESSPLIMEDGTLLRHVVNREDS